MIVYPLVLVVWKVWKVWKLWNFRLSCKPPAISEAVLKSLAGRTSLLHFCVFRHFGPGSDVAGQLFRQFPHVKVCEMHGQGAALWLCSGRGVTVIAAIHQPDTQTLSLTISYQKLSCDWMSWVYLQSL